MIVNFIVEEKLIGFFKLPLINFYYFLYLNKNKVHCKD